MANHKGTKLKVNHGMNVERERRRGAQANRPMKKIEPEKDVKTLSSQKKNGKSKCSLFKRCGGCNGVCGAYEASLKAKEDKVRKLLSPYCKVHPIMGMEDPYYYRNKVHAVFDRKKDGTIISGIYEEASHRVVNVDTCFIEDQQADQIIVSIRKLLKDFKIKIYDENTGYGLLRHVLIRKGFATGEIMVVLVCTSPIFPSKNNFVKALLKLHPEITTVVLNINDRRTTFVLGERNINLYGKGYVEDVLLGVRFVISPNSFYQINPVQTEKLYGKALELASLTGEEEVLDAYSGIGTIGLIASSKSKQVTGVELNRQAVKDAISNAKKNNIKNARFYAGDAGVFMVEQATAGKTYDVVFMDPPRSGSDEAFLTSIAKAKPGRVVYISCNPETQARDLAILEKYGYEAKGAWPVDMFPWTEAIETCALLVKKHN